MNYSKLSMWILVIGTFLFPWVFSFTSVDYIEPIKNILLFVMVLSLTVIFLIRSVNNREIKFVKTPLDVPILLWVTINIVSAILSVSQVTSLYGFYSRFTGGLISTLALAAIYFLVVNLLRDTFQIKKVVMSLIASISILSFVTFLKLIGVLDPMLLDLAKSNVAFSLFSSGSSTLLGGFDQFSLLLLITIPVSLQLMVSSKSSRENILLLVGSMVQLVLFLGINLQSFPLFSAYASLVLLLIGIGYVIFKNKAQWLGSHLVQLVAVVCIVLISIVVFAVPTVRDGLNLKPGFLRSSELNFTFAWYVSTKTWTEIPVRGLLVGSGPDTYFYAFNRFKPQELATSEFSKSSTGVFELMSNTGILGLIVFIILTLNLFKLVFRKLVIASSDKDNSYVIAVGVGAILFILGSFINNTFISVQYVFYLFLSILSIGYVYLNRSNLEEIDMSFTLKKNKNMEISSFELFPLISIVIVFVVIVVGFINISANVASNYVFQKATLKENEISAYQTEKQNELDKQEVKKALIDKYKEVYTIVNSANSIQSQDYYLRKLALYGAYIVLTNQSTATDSKDSILTDNEISAYQTAIDQAITLSISSNPSNYQNRETGSSIYLQFYGITEKINKDKGDKADPKTSGTNNPYFISATNLANQSLGINPYRIDSLNIIGQLLATINTQDAQSNAKSALEKSFNLNPSNGTTISLLGQFYESNPAYYTQAVSFYISIRDRLSDKASELYKNLDKRIIELNTKLEAQKKEVKK